MFRWPRRRRPAGPPASPRHRWGRPRARGWPRRCPPATAPRTLAQLVVSRMTLAEKLGELVLDASGSLRERERRRRPPVHPLAHPVRRPLGPGLRRHRGHPAARARWPSVPPSTRRWPSSTARCSAPRPVARVSTSARARTSTSTGSRPVGRADESYGEDPLLTTDLGVADIEGIQAQGVMADAKHLLAYQPGDQPGCARRPGAEPCAPGDLPAAVQGGRHPGARGLPHVRLPAARRRVPVRGPRARPGPRPVGVRRLRPLRPRCRPRPGHRPGVAGRPAEAVLGRRALRADGARAR